MPDSDFDFVSYIASVLFIPSHHITVQKLTGGYANVTVRATFFPPADFTCIGHPSQILDSVVLKYVKITMAPSTQVMSTESQLIEAHALKLVSPESDILPGVSALRAKHPLVKIPRLIYHDTEKRVLWMSDLGSRTKLLTDWLTSDPPPLLHAVEQFASVLGQFLAEFASTTRNPSAEAFAHVPNLQAVGKFYEALASETRTCLMNSDIVDAETLAARSAQAFGDCGKIEPCLGMVDLWPGNVIVDEVGNCGLVDWEWFGLSSASNELGMFGKSSLPRLERL